MNRLKKFFVSCLICLLAVETCSATKRRKNKNKNKNKIEMQMRDNTNNIQDKNNIIKSNNDRTLIFFNLFFEDSNFLNIMCEDISKKIVNNFFEEEFKEPELEGFYSVKELKENGSFIKSELDRDLENIRNESPYYNFFWLDRSNTKESINSTKLGYNEHSYEILKKVEKRFNKIKEYIKNVFVSTEEEFFKKFNEYFEKTKIQFEKKSISMAELNEKYKEVRDFFSGLIKDLKKLYDKDLKPAVFRLQDNKELYESIKNFKSNLKEKTKELKNLKVFENAKNKEVLDTFMEDIINYCYHNARYKCHEKRAKFEYYNENVKEEIQKQEYGNGRNNDIKKSAFIDKINTNFNLLELKTKLDKLNYCFTIFDYDNTKDSQDRNRYNFLKNGQSIARILKISNSSDFSIILNKICKEYFKRINSLKKQNPTADLIDSNFFNYNIEYQNYGDEETKNSIFIQVGPIPQDKLELYGIKENPITLKKREIYGKVFEESVVEAMKNLRTLSKQEYEFMYQKALLQYENIDACYENFKEDINKDDVYFVSHRNICNTNYHGRHCTSFYKMYFLNNYKKSLEEKLNNFFEENLGFKYNDIVKNIKLWYKNDCHIIKNIYMYLDSIGDNKQIMCEIKFKDNVKKDEKDKITGFIEKNMTEMVLDSMKSALTKTKNDFKGAKDKESFEKIRSDVLEFIRLNNGEEVFKTLKGLYEDIENAEEIPYQDEYSKYFCGVIEEIYNRFNFEGEEKPVFRVKKLKAKENKSLVDVKEEEAKYNKLEIALKGNFEDFCKNDKEKIKKNKEYFKKELIKRGYLKQLTDEDIRQIIHKKLSYGMLENFIIIKQAIDSFLNDIGEYILNKNKSKNEIQIENINSVDAADSEKFLKLCDILDDDFKIYCKNDKEKIKINKEYFLNKLIEKGYLKQLTDEEDIEKLKEFKKNFDGDISKKSIKDAIDYFEDIIGKYLFNKEQNKKKCEKILSLFDEYLKKLYENNQKKIEIFKMLLSKKIISNLSLDKLDEEDIEKLSKSKPSYEQFKIGDSTKRIKLIIYSIKKYLSTKNINKNEVEEENSSSINEKKNNINNLNSINENKNGIDEESLNKIKEEEERIYKKLESMFEEDFKKYYKFGSKEYKDIKDYFKRKVMSIKNLNLTEFDEEDIEDFKRNKKSIDEIFKKDNFKYRIKIFINILQKYFLNKNFLKNPINENDINIIDITEKEESNLRNKNKSNKNNNLIKNSINENKNETEKKESNLRNKNKRNKNNNLIKNSINENKNETEKEETDSKRFLLSPTPINDETYYTESFNDNSSNMVERKYNNNNIEKAKPNMSDGLGLPPDIKIILEKIKELADENNFSKKEK